MTAIERWAGSWLGATADVVLAAVAFHVVWYPAVSLGNAVLGAPLAASTVRLVVFALALGSAYPVVAGDWRLWRIADYAVFLVLAAFAWGAAGFVLVAASGLDLSGSDPRPQAVLWAFAYLSAYVVVARTDHTVFR